MVQEGQLEIHNAALIPRGEVTTTLFPGARGVVLWGGGVGTEAVVMVGMGAGLGRGGARGAVEGRWCSGLVTVCAMWLQQHSRHGKERSRPREPRLILSRISKMKTNITFFTLAMGQR